MTSTRQPGDLLACLEYIRDEAGKHIFTPLDAEALAEAMMRIEAVVKTAIQQFNAGSFRPKTGRKIGSKQLQRGIGRKP